MIKNAIPAGYFQGEMWFKCPYCGMSYEYFDAVFKKSGITKDKEENVYICKCGEKFSIK